MDILVYDENLVAVTVLDSYESLIWNDKYSEAGDFEFYTPISQEIVDNVKPNYYLSIKDSEHMMIVEDRETETDIEDGNKIKITGRSLESILERRIIWGEQTLIGKLEDVIRSLINTNIVNPSDTSRQIPNFIYEDSGDASINEIDVNEQYEGENLLTVISNLCTANEIGFKVTLDDENRFVFKLYKGANRSYDQDILPWVVFRPDFDNIIKSDYKEEIKDYKTITLVSGTETIKTEETDPDTGRTTTNTEDVPVTRVIGSGSGLLRREIFTSATDIRRDEEMSHDEFIAQLDRKGTDTLREHSLKKSFDGDFETTRMFVYKRDFFLGDKVQVANEYGIESPSRITEFVYSIDSSGVTSHPVFTALDYPE